MTVYRRFGQMGIVFVLATVWMACSSSPTRTDEGERSDIPLEGPEPGPLEERIRQCLIDMTDLLLVENEDPQATVESIGSYLQENQEEIRQSVRDLRQRILEMDYQQRVFYEERFSAYFEPTTRRWMAALDDFRRNHPQHATLIDGLMMYFD